MQVLRDSSAADRGYQSIANVGELGSDRVGGVPVEVGAGRPT